MALIDKFRLDGQVAVVTGAGKGIGAGIARAFAEVGANVVLGARTEEDLKAVAADVEALGQKALVVPTDVMDFEQLQRLWESGEISTTDYLVQLRQTVDVQDSALDLRQLLWRAWFEWLMASGQVDTWLGK